MEFLSVILGTDNNAYSMARSVHMAYGQRSICLGAAPLSYTADSRICEVHIYPSFDGEGFLQGIEDFLKGPGARYVASGIPMVIIPCSDGYAKLAIVYRERLERVFCMNVPSLALQEALENKSDFYRAAEAHGLPYPKTSILSREAVYSGKIDYPGEGPYALKPDDSIAYAHLSFAGKQKAYSHVRREEVEGICRAIYDAGYEGAMILQDFIPGGSDAMGVLNAYVDRSGCVRLMSFARCVLDECLPTQIGNYNALLSCDNPPLYDRVASFLTSIGYRGFANFDFKFDARDGVDKCFEINLRQGRSSFYVTAAGANLAQYLIEDVVFGRPMPVVRTSAEVLWLFCAPSVARRYASAEDARRIRPLIREGKVAYTCLYAQDAGWKRRFRHWRRMLSTMRYYPKHEPRRREQNG